MRKTFLLILILLIAVFFSCKKDAFLTSNDARIAFSVDTVFFDTVFVSTGSITQSVKIINLNDQKLLLSNIKLMGGNNGVFKTNIDGNSSSSASNIELAANDSIYVFVTVYINPNNSNQPFILSDSIQVSFNGNQKYIQLQAYGQNAHFLTNKNISGNTTWPNDLPYVIMGSLQVDSNAQLNIVAASRIYFHANAPLIVNGSLNVQGSPNNRVYFLSDRLDYPYSQYPGSWPGIYFLPSSSNNNLQSAVISNAYQGLVTIGQPSGNNAKLNLSDCIINNISNFGILSAQSSITAQNCLISNCGQNLLLSYGGNYSFINCTVASYNSIFFSHTSPVLNMSNADTSGNFVADMSAQFTNCIFWGDSSSVPNEVVATKQGNTLFNINFSNCLWRVKNPPSNVVTNNMLSIDPQFDSLSYQKNFYDFHLKAGSPAIDQGLFTGIPYDLDGNNRLAGAATDLGCYEKQ